MYYIIRALTVITLVTSFYASFTDNFLVGVIGLISFEAAILLLTLYWADILETVNRIQEEAQPLNPFSEPVRTGPSGIIEAMTLLGLTLSISFVHVPSQNMYGGKISELCCPTMGQYFPWFLAGITVLPSATILVFRAVKARRAKKACA